MLKTHLTASYVARYFFLTDFNILPLSLIFATLITLCLGLSHFLLILFGALSVLPGLECLLLSQARELSVFVSWNTFSAPFHLSFYLHTCNTKVSTFGGVPKHLILIKKKKNLQFLFLFRLGDFYDSVFQFAGPIHFYHLIYLWFLLVFFFLILIIIFFISGPLKKNLFVKLLILFIFSYLEFMHIITLITFLNSLLGTLLISVLLSSPGFLLFHLKDISVTSFCLILCFHFYVLGKSVTFPDLGEVALWGSAWSILPSVHHIYMLQGCILCGLCVSFCYGGGWLLWVCR